MSELTTVKAIAEIRYPNAPLFASRRAEVVQAFVKRYEPFTHWRIGGDGCAVFDNEATKEHYAVAKLDVAAVIQLYPSSGAQFVGFASEFFKTVRANLKVTELSGIALQLALAGEFEDGAAMMAYFRSAFFDSTSNAWLQFGDVTDYGVAVDTDDGDDALKISFGPMLRQQYAERLELSEEHMSDELWERIPHHGFLLDVKRARTTPRFGKGSSAKEYLLDAWGDILERAERFLAMVEEAA